MHKFLSTLAAGIIALSTVSPAFAAQSKALSARYNLKVNMACQGKRALKRAECVHQFKRDVKPEAMRMKQRERACIKMTGLEKAACLKTQRRVWGENRSDSSSSESSTSSSSSSTSSSASSN